MSSQNTAAHGVLTLTCPRRTSRVHGFRFRNVGFRVVMSHALSALPRLLMAVDLPDLSLDASVPPAIQSLYLPGIAWAGRLWWGSPS